jgi:hypothetical protein
MMRRVHGLAGALVAALAAVAVVVAVGAGSSHREAPLTSLDPTGDDTDVYAFTAKDAPGALTVVANWIPFEDPAGGPNFYRFDDRAHYYINVDNTGDGAWDVRYLFTFHTKIGNKGTFLYALPGVSSITDPKLNVKQFYDVTRLRYRKGKVVSSNVVARSLPVAPNNVGPKTIPDYNAVANQAIRTLRGGGKVFAGQREDPFFVDLGATFDGINLRNMTGNAGGGKDDLAGYGVHSIVLQVPEAAVTRDAKPVADAKAADAVIGVWSSTERRRLQVTNQDKGSDAGWVQVSRLGNPLVNEVVIPLTDKDRFNRTQPADDAKNYGKYVVTPHLAAVMNQLFDLGVKTNGRTDIVTALLTGIPGVTQISPKPAAADTLKINLGVPPSDKENRFGVIGGDNAGFPNGRRLGDDVVDIELRVIGGYLIGKKLPLGDGVDGNDVSYLGTFPYVAPLQSGLDSKLKRDEPKHDPTAADAPS